MKTLALSVVGILALTGLGNAQNTQPPKDEIQAYLEACSRGEAGVNPRDVTLARSGDPYAQARIRLRLANNAIQAQQNQGTITAEEAAYRRQQAQLDYQREEQRIEMERIRMELERQKWELEQLRIEAQLRNYEP